MQIFKNKIILITEGADSIGEVLVKKAILDGTKKPIDIKLYFKNLKSISKDEVVTMLKKIY